ncbi:MAG: single-stranded DNA-binding protein [Planctomycetota bacterium]|nr:single-stranded DNA-binding protein [Planctomycetota bacterium]MDW8373459.1 single-stranded DNA-binding protein [Planctomycetota bacterium]
MANINRVFLAGNLTRDPQVRFLANERAVAEFGLAINRRYKAPDGSIKEETTFVDIEVWGRQAELCSQYLTKGRSCFVEGRLKLDTWEDKKDGSKRSKLRVVADNVQFLGAPPKAAEGGADAEMEAGPGDSGVKAARPAAPPPADDEPPF